MNLKSALFSDPEVSTHKDVNGILIKAGDKLLADSNSVFYVHRDQGRFVVATETDLRKEAIAFAEWIVKNRWGFHLTDKYWFQEGQNDEYTIEQLYSLFKKNP